MTVEEKIVEVVKEVEVEKVVRVVERAAAEKQRVVVYRDRVTSPDGTVREREVERTDTDRREDTHEAEVREVVREVEVVKEVEKRVVVEAPRPQWRAGPLVGVDVHGWRPAYGGVVERRITGPLSVGAWGLYGPATVTRPPAYVGGLAVTLEF